MKAREKDRKILVIVEREKGQLAPITYELFHAGKDLVGKIDASLCAVLLGDGICETSNEIAKFSDTVYCIHNPLLTSFQVELYAHVLERICREIDADVILMGHTLVHLDLAPRLAYKLGAQIITDCLNLAVEPETECLLCTKPVYGAKIIATFKLEKKPYVVTIRPKALEPIVCGTANGRVSHFDASVDGSSVKIALMEKIEEENIRLDKAETIVAGGRGIKDSGGLKQLQEMVRVLKNHFSDVELGASRPLVDMGLIPSYRQIGLTGEKVAPLLYIAVGISGSLQHITGMSGAKKIVAINNNPKAPIFEIAHYGVIGDYEEVVPAVIKKLKELR